MEAQDFGDDEILIPIRQSEEFVRVSVEELPDLDVQYIIDILKAELAPLDVWLKCAVKYYKTGSPSNFKTILELAAQEDLENVEAYKNAKSKKERIAILNVLAAYFVKLATKTKEEAKKEEYYNQATANYNKADKIDLHEEMTWVGKGILLLCKGKQDRALKYFETVLERNEKNTPALLGKGCIYYNQGKYSSALEFYCSALTHNPNCPPNVRLGLGYCYYRLGKVEEALEAFARVLELEPDNVHALAAFAVLELNRGQSEDSVHKALSLLKRAYEADPEHPLVLNHLSNHFFYKKDYKKAITLARNALYNTQVKEIKSESFYYLGRAYHAQGEYEQAYQFYYRATDNWPDNVLAQFGLGQMYMFMRRDKKGENEEAIACFKAVLQKHPGNYETLKVLGSLYASCGKKEEAIQNFKKVLETHADDIDAWIEMAELVESRDYKEAHDCYVKAANLLEEQGQQVPLELWNNIGVLCFKLGDLAGSSAALESALKVSTGWELSDLEFKASNISSIYNLARMYEAGHEYQKAEHLYKAILKEHPNYVDCYLRLGGMARERGNIYEASEWYKETFAIDHDEASAWCLLGNLHLHKEEWLPAQKKFEYILSKSDTAKDPYALLSLGNIYYTAKFDKHDKSRMERYLSHAFKYYWQVIRQDPTNIYAANGLGIILAEKSYLAQAKEFFIKVREATSDMPDVWVNLAHIYLSQGQFVNAIKMYQNCLRKFYDNKEPTILLFLAKAYYEFGKMEDCKRALLKAIHLTPENFQLWYNLALSQQKNAHNILNTNKIALKKMERALRELKKAKQVFGDLSVRQKAAKRSYHVHKAKEHHEKCNSMIGKLEEKLSKAIAEEAKQEEERRKRREAMELKLRMREEQEKAHAEAQNMERKKMEEIANLQAQKLAQIQQKWVERNVPKQQSNNHVKRNSNSRRIPTFGDGEFDEIEENDLPKAQKKRKSRPRKARATKPPQDVYSDTGSENSEIELPAKKHKLKKKKRKRLIKKKKEKSSSEELFSDDDSLPNID
eukprot:CAMPEP_0174270756 /NCGR_PEP_ID=MMETSP0439-20130205/45618_1 /TAXON_ID=0 /ORGANISM="Stereomyxa ramosa, Strain Chinc5" /LENGTH=1018 /DNA_ID=CAMNT_0015360281 /DNA_START=21 /DNA_END=3074 /DNA_ORIENTATION=+